MIFSEHRLGIPDSHCPERRGVATSTPMTEGSGTDSSSEVRYEESTDRRVAIIRLGDPGERAVSLTAKRLGSFELAIDRAESEKKLGVVITGTGPDMFCVGADVSVIQAVEDPAYGASLATTGQRLYERLERSPLRTVAAISGPCVGGGCELVLACDFRVMSERPSSTIGLPETKLGILPGWGGTQRLPRLIGLPAALDVILAGKTQRAKAAAKSGFVDELVPYEKLLARAVEIASGAAAVKRRTWPFTVKLATNFAPVRKLVLSMAKKQVQKSTKGRYPAPPKAIEAISIGLSRGLAQGFQHEAKALGDLIVTPESKSLVRIFFLTEAAKGHGKAARQAVEGVQTVVIGAGVMGAGIAASFARAEHLVVLKDTTDENLTKGTELIAAEVKRSRSLSSLEKGAIRSRVETARWNSHSLRRAKLVVEAVFEEMSLKKRIFSDLASQVSDDCILASNTSSLSITEMMAEIPNPSRGIGMHFFNPVAQMPLVEIVRGAQTSDAAVQFVAAMSTRLGKFPIVVRDVPGFLVNRVLVPYLNEATYLLAEGFSIEQIDRAALRFGMPMGPLRLLDEVGLDVAQHVGEVMVAGYGSRMKGLPYAKTMVEAGRKGKKSGKGFYDYSNKKKSLPDPAVAPLLGLAPTRSSTPPEQEIEDRLILHLVNEAKKCLHEGVAGADRDTAEKQIDLGSVMGIGFPPFRGGVLWHARMAGEQRLRDRLAEFESKFGERYRPWDHA
jgi:3-hydroxyacyl-CoA dehydrogenase / enoyl-CoA hydratase / 3-hydroxybutyryl-CoA epimerase